MRSPGISVEGRRQSTMFAMYRNHHVAAASDHAYLVTPSTKLVFYDYLAAICRGQSIISETLIESATMNSKQPAACVMPKTRNGPPTKQISFSFAWVQMAAARMMNASHVMDPVGAAKRLPHSQPCGELCSYCLPKRRDSANAERPIHTKLVRERQ